MPTPFNIPNTLLASAFMKALVRLVSANHSKTKRKIAIPTGVADIDEVELVLRALGLIRDDRRGPR